MVLPETSWPGPHKDLHPNLGFQGAQVRGPGWRLPAVFNRQNELRLLF